MLYSILSQINKGLRRIDILRKTGKRAKISTRIQAISLANRIRISPPVQSSTGSDPLPDIFWFVRKRAVFHIKRGNSLLTKKTRTESEYDLLPSVNARGSHKAGNFHHPMNLHRTNRWLPAGIASEFPDHTFPDRAFFSSCQEGQIIAREFRAISMQGKYFRRDFSGNPGAVFHGFIQDPAPRIPVDPPFRNI